MTVERCFKVVTMLACVTAVLGARSAAAQPVQPAQPAYTLTVTKDDIPFLTLKAKDAKLWDIGADLAQRLNARVIVGPSLKDERVSVDFSGTTLEPAMLALAPRVYFDYELRSGVPPRPLGIYLLGNEDVEPARTAVVQGNSQGLLVQGNTEDTGQPPKDGPLRIFYDKGRLTVFAKQQPLIAVVMAIAEELGVPAEIKYESRALIDADIRETPAIEEAFTSLAENVRVYVRTNPVVVEKTLLRVVVVEPVK